MDWALIVTVTILALLGNARIFLFALNRFVFRQKREGDRIKPALIGLPPLLALLSLLYLPLIEALAGGALEGLAIAGALWLAVTVTIGVYWIVDRAWQRSHREPPAGVVSHEPEVIRLRKAHIPFRSLQRLGLHNDLYDLELTRHTIRVPDLPPEFDGYRIAFLTDTHVTGFMRRAFYRECVARVGSESVDLVLLGGDFVTWERHIPLMARLLLEGLEARDGVFAVLGNHDYWADPDGIIAAMTSRGVRFLVNRSVMIRRGGQAIDLVGIDEVYRGSPDLAKSFDGVPGNRPCVAVSHHPDIVEFLEGRRVDLLVAGHTHGGQIRFPFFGAVVVPSAHEALYAAGFHRKHDTLLYVSRGLGSVPPVRILCRPEIAFFTLRSLEPA